MRITLGRSAAALLAIGAGALAPAAMAKLPANTVVDAEDQSPPILNNLSSDGASVVTAWLPARVWQFFSIIFAPRLMSK